MDLEGFSFEHYRHCLSDIRRLNAWTFAAVPTLKTVGQFYREHLNRNSARPMNVVDIGFGSGDTLVAVAREARRRGWNLKLQGLEISAWAIEVARQFCEDESALKFHLGDFRTFDFGEPVDVVISSLMTHHLKDEQIVEFIDWMNRTCQVGWFIHDIHRHVIPYYAMKWSTRWLGLNEMVQHDAPLSVAKAFRRCDWERLLARAQTSDFSHQVRWHCPFKYGVRALRCGGR